MTKKEKIVFVFALALLLAMILGFLLIFTGTGNASAASTNAEWVKQCVGKVEVFPTASGVSTVFCLAPDAPIPNR